MAYAIFGADGQFRRVASGTHLDMAGNETAVCDPPDGIGAGWLFKDGQIVGPSSPSSFATAPDNPTLSDWRVALVLWGRLDDLLARVHVLAASGNPLGRVAQERVEYSNNVLREQLMLLKDVLGFTTAEVDESLWRADRVRQGDVSGIWPV